MSNNVDENFSDMNDDDFINYLKKQEQIKEFRSEKDYEEQRKEGKQCTKQYWLLILLLLF